MNQAKFLVVLYSYFLILCLSLVVRLGWKGWELGPLPLEYERQIYNRFNIHNERIKGGSSGRRIKSTFAWVWNGRGVMVKKSFIMVFIIIIQYCKCLFMGWRRSLRLYSRLRFGWRYLGRRKNRVECVGVKEKRPQSIFSNLGYSRCSG